MRDDAIIELFFERTEKAITELASKYGQICLNTAENITQSREDAKECVNDAYLVVWNSVPPTRPASLLAYVLRIVRNISINRVKYNNAEKRGGRYQESLDELKGCLSSPDTTEKLYDAKELTIYIEEFLDGLSHTNRLLFVRRYWYLDSFEMLAAETGLGPGAVRTRLTRLRQRLKQFLLEKGIVL